MDERLKNIQSGEELVKFLAEHSEKSIPYTQEEREFIFQMLERFGLSRNVFRTHYEIPKKR